MAKRIRKSSTLLALGSLALGAGTAHAVNVRRAVVSRVAPVYPELARRMHIGGRVVLLVSVDANGNVSSTKVESGHALLAPAAEEAVKRWHFAPNPEPTVSEIDVNFDMDSQ
ncbi:energy transducer TonB [Edaphobacter sp.]|uniref:energy transducer TonB n=1 Tax=Edaphobacter sp. TaxID=1934404 RepID=UPI002DB7C825|nr:energy transducer TonB [Edaphobacter sp.]HEU5342261.1 energy transducer TonB [Edaphobacter sp.]